MHDEDEIRGTGKGQGRKGKKDEKKSHKGKKNRYAGLTDTTMLLISDCIFRKTSAMRAEEDAAVGSPVKLTRFVHHLPYIHSFTNWLPEQNGNLRPVVFQWHHPSESVQLWLWCLTSHPSLLFQLYVSETPRMGAMTVMKGMTTMTTIVTAVATMTITMEMKTATAATLTVTTMQTMMIRVTMMMVAAQMIALMTAMTARIVMESNKDIHLTKLALTIRMMMNASETVTVIVRQPAREMRSSTIALVNLRV